MHTVVMVAAAALAGCGGSAPAVPAAKTEAEVMRSLNDLLAGGGAEAARLRAALAGHLDRADASSPKGLRGQGDVMADDCQDEDVDADDGADVAGQWLQRLRDGMAQSAGRPSGTDAAMRMIQMAQAARMLQTLRAMQGAAAMQQGGGMVHNPWLPAGDSFWSSRFSAGNSNADNTQGYVSVPGYGPVGYGF